MYPFSTPWKHKKTIKFLMFLGGYRRGALGTDGLPFPKGIKGAIINKVL